MATPRVLHLPSNFASQMNNMVRGLRALGVDARGITLSSSPLQSKEAVKAVLIPKARRDRMRAIPDVVRSYWHVAREMYAADVVHWHGAGNVLPRGLDAMALSRQGQAKFVTFWGSEIRIPEIATQGNPFIAELLSRSDCDYAISFRKSRAAQERFAARGFQCIVPGPELPDYIQRDLFPKVFSTEVTVHLADLADPRSALVDPSLPSRPRVVHAPSRQLIKGTREVIEIVERLQRTVRFDFQLIHGVPHGEALQMMRAADIVLDQFVLGAYGTVSLEAMGMGKVAVCYLTDAVARRIHRSCPIINASFPTLAETLAQLLGDRERREELGARGRQYVRAFHSTEIIAPQLAATYSAALGAPVP